MKDSLFIKPLQYKADSVDYFLRIAGWVHPVWLDSNSSGRGRYDILAAEPLEWFSSEGPAAQVMQSHERFLSDLKQSLDTGLNVTSGVDLPFSGGFIGQLTYDFGRRVIKLPNSATTDIDTPDAEAGYYAWAIIQDHQQCASYFVSRLGCQESAALLLRLEKTQMQLEALKLTSVLSSAYDKRGYVEAFNAIQEYILAGDCYQVNLAQRYKAEFTGDPLALYLALRQVTRAPFSAYFKGKSSTTLCLSPERFVAVEQGQVFAQPIKGTAARSPDTKRDLASASALSASEKDKAENLMIVDLLRNDIGKVCEPGSITVPALFELQSFAAVHHLVSTITGKLSSDMDAVDLLAAVFPGGSITGAPKKRAMEIIDELEPYRRNSYCGSLFYLNGNGKLDSNILIRSVLCYQNTLYCWGGGGIVADSTADAEWLEIEDKIGTLLQAIRATAE